MTFQLVCIEPKELTQYKADMQEAFQKGFEDAFGKTDAVILPEKDIDQSLNAEGSAVYKAVVDGEMVGGAVVIINESTQHNHLDLLFVKNGVQSNGIGKKIWFELERIYPNTKVWETCTPYFDKRNIHFYVNVCGFHITEFFNEKHPMPDTPDEPGHPDEPDDSVPTGDTAQLALYLALLAASLAGAAAIVILGRKGRKRD